MHVRQAAGIGRSAATLALIAAMLMASTVFAAAAVEITFGSWRDQDQAIVDAFNAQNPDIQVEFTLYGYDTINDRLPLTAMSETAAYDVVRIDHNHLALLTMGIFQPLDNLVAKEQFDLSEYLEPNVQMYQWKGSQYAVPVSSNAEAFGFNMEHFDAAGLEYPHKYVEDGTWTRDTFKDLAKKLTRDKDGDGVPDLWGFTTPVNWVAHMFWNMAGGGSLSPEGELIINSEGTRDGLTFLYNLLHVDRIWDPNSEWNTFMANPERAAMSGFYGWSIGFANEQDFRYDITVWPTYKVKRMIGASGDGVAIMANSPNADAAWEFIKYLAGPEGLEGPTESGAIMPAHIPTILSPAFLKPGSRPANRMAFLTTVQEYTRPVPYHPLRERIDGIFWEQVSKVIAGETPPTAAIETAHEQALPVYEEWLAQQDD